MLTVNTNNHVSIDGAATGYGVVQDAQGTRVYNVRTGEPIKMPAQRYGLAHSAPASGVLGAEQFERDLRAAINWVG